MQGDVFTDFDVASLSAAADRQPRRDRGRFVMRIQPQLSVSRRLRRRETFVQHFEWRHLRSQGKLMNTVDDFCYPFRRCARAGRGRAQARKTINASSCRSATRRARPSSRSRCSPATSTVEGYDGNEIVIVADAPMRDANGEEEPRADGLTPHSELVGRPHRRRGRQQGLAAHGLQPEKRRPRGARTAPHVGAREPRQRRRHRDHGCDGRARALERQRRRHRDGHLGLGRHERDERRRARDVRRRRCDQVDVVHVVQRRRRRRVAREPRRPTCSSRASKATCTRISTSTSSRIRRSSSAAATRAAGTASACSARRATRSAAAAPTFSCARSTATS